MSIFTTVRCRVSQCFSRIGRKMRPVKSPSFEEGVGALFSVPQIVRNDRLQKPMVILGKTAGSWGEQVTQALEENDIPYVVWDALSDPPVADDGENIRLTWIGKKCDRVLVIGDGRDIDIAKVAAARAACREQSIMSMVGREKIHKKKLPTVIAIPTVAGTGAESFSLAYLKDLYGGEFIVESHVIVPAHVIADPALLKEVPRPVVAKSAIDGLCLAVEAYLSGYAKTQDRADAAQAVRDILRSAEPCWNDGGTDMQRSVLLEGSFLAGRAASKAGYGYVRAMCHAVDRVSGADPYEACAVILPTTLEKYGNTAQERLAALAEEADVAIEGSQEEKATALIDSIRAAAFRMGLPDTLEGVDPTDLAEIADMAAAEADPYCAAPAVWTASQVFETLQIAHSGR